MLVNTTLTVSYSSWDHLDPPAVINCVYFLVLDRKTVMPNTDLTGALFSGGLGYGPLVRTSPVKQLSTKHRRNKPN